MPARVVLVHDDPEFVEQAAAAIENAGFSVATFTDQAAAVTALERMRLIDLLITRLRYGPGKPHGINLAQMARKRRPGLKVLFIALPEFAEQAAELGEFMPLPVAVPDLVDAVHRLLPPAPSEDPTT